MENHTELYNYCIGNGSTRQTKKVLKYDHKCKCMTNTSICITIGAYLKLFCCSGVSCMSSPGGLGVATSSTALSMLISRSWLMLAVIAGALQSSKICT